MEPAEAPAQANWNPLSAAAEPGETDIVAQLLNTYSLTSDSEQEPSFGLPSIFWSDHDVGASYPYSSDNGVGYILDYWPQGCSSLTGNGGVLLPPPAMGSYHLGDANVVEAMNGSFVPMDFCMTEAQNDHSSLLGPVEHLLEEPAASMNEDASSEDLGASYANAPEPVSLPSRKSPPKRKLQVPELDKKDVHDKGGKDSAINPKKKPRSAADAVNNGKSAQSKKATKAAVRSGDAEEGSTAGLNAQAASSSYSSEDDSSASQEMNGERARSGSKSSAAPNSKGKTRAGRGSATDPQSLYARKRRERINERLRILQKLVPNGTKVDISTMLEEAVQYVKFLQLQIKLLSSDDLWMYAPIAYNGMNLGLDLKISHLNDV